MALESTNGDQEISTGTSEAHISLVVVLFVCSVLILVENSFTIVSILQFTRRKNTFTFLIVSLSLAEVFNVCGPNGIVSYAIMNKDRDLNDFFTLCRVQAWLMVFFRIAATILVFVLTLDRVFQTIFPQFYHKHWKGKLFIIIFFGIWICATFLATWPLLWLEGFKVSSDSGGLFCLFPYDNTFAVFFVLFHVLLLVISCLCFYAIFGMASKNSFDTGNAKQENMDISSRQLIAERDILASSKEPSRLVALVTVVYFCSLLPWMVALSLGIYSIEYPSLFGLCAIQLPMASGLLNPVLYSICWLPFRRAYIRALKWPGAKCFNRQSSLRARSHTLNTSMGANHGSFWLSDSLEDEDGEQENAFQILFGPTSYIKPLDFNPGELEMFEHDSQMCAFSNNNGSASQHSKPTIWRETGDHFQNILDLIDAMTDGNRQKVIEKGLGRESKASNSTHKQTGDDSNTGISRHSTSLELSFRHPNSSLIPGLHYCRKYSNGSADCSCLGKTRCYVVERKNRELDFPVSGDLMESASSRESVRIEI